MRTALTFFMLLALAGNAAAYTFTDCEGNDCYWISYPVSYYIQEPLGIEGDEETIIETIQAAFNRWNYEHQTFCAPLMLNYAGRFAADTPAAFDQKNIVSFSTESWSYGQSALAVTTCWYDEKGRFAECDIAFNAVNYHWTPDGEGNTYSIRQTLTHEVGHFWGLDHSTKPTATMYAYYKPSSAPEDLDEDDIRGAAVRFCDEEMPADDNEEPNDSFYNARVHQENINTLSDLRLYDDDWWRVELAEGKRLKVSSTDEGSERFKILELYDEDGERLDRQLCLGDCAQALGVAGSAKSVFFRVTGDYDNHAVQAKRYDLLFEQVIPGEEGELSDDDLPPDDDDDDDDDSNGGCGCGVTDDGNGTAATAGFFVLISLSLFIGIRRRLRGEGVD